MSKETTTSSSVDAHLTRNDTWLADLERRLSLIEGTSDTTVSVDKKITSVQEKIAQLQKGVVDVTKLYDAIWVRLKDYGVTIENCRS